MKAAPGCPAHYVERQAACPRVVFKRWYSPQNASGPSWKKHAAELRGFGVRRIGVFGSVAKGEAQADQDLQDIVQLNLIKLGEAAKMQGDRLSG